MLEVDALYFNIEDVALPKSRHRREKHDWSGVGDQGVDELHQLVNVTEDIVGLGDRLIDVEGSDRECRDAPEFSLSLLREQVLVLVEGVQDPLDQCQLAIDCDERVGLTVFALGDSLTLALVLRREGAVYRRQLEGAIRVQDGVALFFVVIETIVPPFTLVSSYRERFREEDVRPGVRECRWRKI